MQNGIVLWADKTGKISKSDIANTCPDISISMIERTLKEMLDHGEIKKIGSGRATAYVKKLTQKYFNCFIQLQQSFGQ